jgi:FlaA1/EpsC-like NDP-sugar epimerase
MLSQLRNPHFYFILFVDLFLICISLVAAYLIRFEFILTQAHYEQILKLLPVMVIVKLLFLFGFKAYKGMFRYASLSDLWQLFKALVSATVFIVFIVFFIQRFQGLSRAVFVIDGVVTFLFLGGFRLMIRIVYQQLESRRSKIKTSLNSLFSSEFEPTFIIGAGSTGEKILREINGNQRLHYKVIGFLDDDLHKLTRSIHNVPILGKTDDLLRLTKKYQVKQVLIAAPSANGKQIRHMVDQCKKAKVQFKTLPGYAELIDGKVSIKELRDVNYRDLLRREPVKLDIPEIRQYLMNKRVMITGAGGSIGSELCRQITRFQPESLILFDASEPSLYGIEMEMRHRVGYLKYSTVLGCMQDENLVDRVLKRYRPHVIFHAAAYKHVPMLERNPWQAVVNNILGTKVIMEQAVRHKVGHFVMISTDKAVRPTNVMGASKRICELMISAFSRNGTKMMTVRFGNVVNSAGSVVPLFREQIGRGGPVTITHPEVTRFFMTIPEASQLVLQSAALGKGGEIFILDMGTPIKIADMARDLIRLSGKEPDEDIEIVFTGLREGEKLYEELITEGEGIVGTSHEKIMVLKSQDCWNGKKDQKEYCRWLFDQISELEKSAGKYDGCTIRHKMKEIVPEYDLQESECIL